VVGLIQAITIGSEMLDLSRRQSVAMQVIRNEVDNVHLLDWTVVSAIPVGTTFTINVNDAGTALSPNPGDAAKFALTNYTPLTTTDDNVSLMALAKGFQCDLTVTAVKTNLLQLTYKVTWTAGNQRKTYYRTGTTYYGKNGLNLYYRR
jgi:hypothetical protein